MEDPDNTPVVLETWFVEINNETVKLTLTVNFGPKEPDDPADEDYMKAIST